MIEWNAYYTVSSRLDHNDFVRIVKLRTGWLPVNKRATHYITGRKPCCSRCPAGEDIDHLFKCMTGTRQEEWKTQIQKEC